MKGSRAIIVAASALAFSTVSAGIPLGATGVPEIDWDTTLIKFQFDNKKFIGQRFSAECEAAPVDQALDGVFGTDVYPSNNSICIAALHAGRITSEGGRVTVQLNPGQDSYTGSERNGVSTGSLPGTKRSFVFVDSPNGSEETVRQKYIPRIKWDTKFTSTGLAYKQLIGQSLSFRCPRAPSNLRPRRIVGTDAYAWHSMVCRAAVHAGKISTDGGVVTVRIGAAKKKLVGSIRNGVETKGGSGGIRTLSFVDQGSAG
ncbi:MAG: LCCL domain-containing protein [Pseudomonadota bacterium]